MKGSINFDTMTKREIIKYADEMFGLINLDETMKKDELITAVKEVARQSGDVTIITDEMKETNTGPGRGKVRIVVSRSGDKKQHPVFYGHQGVGYLCPRGKEIEVPANTLSGLYDAIETGFEWDENLKTQFGYGGEVTRKMQSYAFSVIEWGPGTEKAQAAFRKSREALSEAS